MTIQKAVDTAKELKPHKYSDDQVIEWLSDLDQLLYKEIISKHEGHDIEEPAAYSATIDMDKELIVPEPYSEVYIAHLYAKIDFFNGDMNRYNNSMLMYNSKFNDYTSWFNRTYMPVQNNYISC